MVAYCDPHGRLDCEDCAFIQAHERGTITDRPDLHSRGPGRAPGITGQATDDPPIAERDTLVPDDSTDLDRFTFVAAGDPVPRELRAALATSTNTPATPKTRRTRSGT